MPLLATCMQERVPQVAQLVDPLKLLQESTLRPLGLTGATGTT